MIEKIEQFKVKIRLPSGTELSFTGSQQDAEFIGSHFKASTRLPIIITDREIDAAWLKHKSVAAQAWRDAVRWTEKKHGVGNAN